MKKIVILFWTGILYATLSFGQFSISGTVTDQDGNLLPGASITIDSTYMGVVCNAQGHYRLGNLKSGRYALSISFIGYTTIHKTIELSTDKVIDFTLTPQPVLSEEIIISAERLGQQTPIAHTIVKKKELDEKNTGKDLPLLLSLQPSIVSTSDAGGGVGYTGMRIRGIGIRGINVTINGIPLNDPESQGVWWVDVPDLASASNSIQIQRGVGASTNGSGAFGSTINIQTMTLQQKAYGEINSFAGSYNTFRNNVKFGTGLINKHFSFDGNFSKITSDGYIDRASSDMQSMDLSGTYYGKKNSLKLVILNGKEKTYQAWYGVPGIYLDTIRTYNYYTYDNETDNYRQSHYQLHYTHQLSSNLHINASLFYIYGAGYYENYKSDKSLANYLMPAIVLPHDTITSGDLITRKWLKNDFYGSNLTWHYRKKQLEIIGGGAYYYYYGQHFGRVIWAQYAGKTPIRHEWYRGYGLKKDANSFMKINYLWNNFNFYVDLQERFIDYTISGTHDDLSVLDSTPHHYTFFNPKAGINYNLSEYASVYIYYGITHREPARRMFVDADTNNIPQAETLNDLEIGYQLKKKNYRIAINLYNMQYDNQLVMTGKINNVGAPIYTNVKNSYRQGIELEAAYRFAKWFSWQGNTTFSRNKIEDFTEYVDNWNYYYDMEHEPVQYSRYLGTTDIAFSPSVIVGSQCIFTLMKGLKITMEKKYVSRQYIDNTSSLKRSLDPYLISNAHIQYTFKTKWAKLISLHLSVYNMFDKKYVSNAWAYHYKSGDGSYDGSYGDLYSTPSDDSDNPDNSGYYDMIGYYPQAMRHFMAGISVKF